MKVIRNRFRIAHYVLAIGLLFLPPLVIIDFQEGYVAPAAVKLLSLVYCIGAFALAFKPHYERFVSVSTGIALLILSGVGAMFKLDSAYGLVWAPVLPVLFIYLAGVRYGLMMSGVYVFVFSFSYFGFETMHGIAPVEMRLWFQSLTAYIASLMVILWLNREQQHKENALRQHAKLDYLTKTLNRRGLIEHVGSEIKRTNRYRRQLSVIVLDIDNFKSINDKYGHNCGDRVLCEISAHIQQRLRASDVLSRWGGEEFVVLTPETNLLECYELAEELRSSIARHSFPFGLVVTVSIGIAEYIPGEEWELFFQRADYQMYSAKHRGKNRVVAANKPPPAAVQKRVGVN